MKSRKGLASVVGMMFAIIAFTTVALYISYSMNILNQFTNSALQITQTSLNAGKEKFQVTNVATANSKFNITIANTGTIPINITNVWIQNTTAMQQQKDFTRDFVLSKGLVSPGATLTNIGQGIPLSVNPTQAYYVKFVTSRGNTQGATINSAGTSPLNIQLFALPTSVNTGFTSELVMIVSNNSTSVITNITPSLLPTSTGLATCSAGPVSPASYNSLSPGSTAIFKWDVTVTGANGQTCTYNLTQPLKNGYSQNLKATITVNVITFTQTNLAQNTGILTLNYSTFRWTQGNQWNTGWSFTGASPTSFSVLVTNNNSTGDFYVAANSQFAFQQSVGGQNNSPFFIVNATTFSPLRVTSFSCSYGDYCIKIPAGQSVALNFASTNSKGSNINNLGAGQYYNMMLMFGKFASSQSGSGTFYAQTIPFIAIQTS